ncbi:hypothetical protein KOR42_06810 [Thalassoglobus neptunius]|uniref:Uncharacterized protein n=1 Tax=Thalassoglobus neptunius TaxID=1938619 RepID=A0A5C5X4S2_9PLAN|nr:cytochrome C oxidase subunit IV family protein [Thalassoglobus neptunius]TWT57321.1 hypothetical protein KOR42_06810 [Thalassoglobus neptunius]
MDHAHDDSHPHVNYFGVFIALCICTAISVAFDLIEISPILLVGLVLAIALAKALFVMTYFMHLKFEGRWKFVVLAPTAVLAVGLMIALAPDMAMHYYTMDTPQSKMVVVTHGGDGHHSEEGDEGHHAEEEHASPSSSH